jgi:hypothetical protein
MDSRNLVESNSGEDENFVYNTKQKEVKLSSHHHKVKKEMTKLLCIKIQVKKTKVDALFDSASHDNIVVEELVSKLGLEVHDHPNPYPLGWVNKYVDIEVTQ